MDGEFLGFDPLCRDLAADRRAEMLDAGCCDAHCVRGYALAVYLDDAPTISEPDRKTFALPHLFGPRSDERATRHLDFQTAEIPVLGMGHHAERIALLEFDIDRSAGTHLGETAQIVHHGHRLGLPIDRLHLAAHERCHHQNAKAPSRKPREPANGFAISIFHVEPPVTTDRHGGLSLQRMGSGWLERFNPVGLSLQLMGLATDHSLALSPSIPSDQPIADRDATDGKGEFEQEKAQSKQRADEWKENLEGDIAADDDEQESDEFCEHGVSFLAMAYQWHLWYRVGNER